MLLALVLPAGLRGQIDEVAATVNQSLITARDLQYHAFEAHFADPRIDAETMEEVLPFLVVETVEDEILYQHFWRPDQEPAEADIREEALADREALALAAGSEEALRAALDEWALTPVGLQQWLEDRARRRWYIEGGVVARLDPSLMNRADETVAEAARVRLAHVLIAPEEGAQGAREDAWKRALNVRVALEEGMSFEEAVKVFSDDPYTADIAGELGWFETGALSEEIRSAVSELSTGGVTAPVTTERGVHLFRLVDLETPERVELRKALAKTRAELLKRLREEMDVRIAEKYQPPDPAEPSVRG